MERRYMAKGEKTRRVSFPEMNGNKQTHPKGKKAIGKATARIPKTHNINNTNNNLRSRNRVNLFLSARRTDRRCRHRGFWLFFVDGRQFPHRQRRQYIQLRLYLGGPTWSLMHLRSRIRQLGHISRLHELPRRQSTLERPPIHYGDGADLLRGGWVRSREGGVGKRNSANSSG